MTAQETAKLCFKIADENKAENISVIEMTNHLNITDYFVICTGLTESHAKGIAYEIEKELKKNKIRPFSIEGEKEGKWILMDYSDVVVHIYLEEVRNYYELEDLWADAPRLNLAS